MPSIADFRLIESSKLNELRDNAEIKIEKKVFSKKVIDNYWDYLNTSSRKLKGFDWDGDIFAYLLAFLEEKKGVDLLKGKYDDIANAIADKRQHSIFILTYDNKQKYLADLSTDKFTLDKLIEFNKHFLEVDDPELAKEEIEGVEVLRDNLDLLTDDNHVILLSLV